MRQDWSALLGDIPREGGALGALVYDAQRLVAHAGQLSDAEIVILADAGSHLSPSDQNLIAFQLPDRDVILGLRNLPGGTTMRLVYPIETRLVAILAQLEELTGKLDSESESAPLAEQVRPAQVTWREEFFALVTASEPALTEASGVNDGRTQPVNVRQVLDSQTVSSDNSLPTPWSYWYQVF